MNGFNNKRNLESFKSIKLIEVLLLLIGFIGLGNSAYASSMVPGDVVQLNYPLDSTISGNYTINEQYEIHFKNSIFIPLKGVDSRSISKSVRMAMAPYYNDVETVKVRILDKKIRVRILGQVFKPGWYSMDPSSDFQDLIEVGGGIKNGAQIDALMFYSNNGAKTETINLRSYLEGDLSLSKRKLSTGDVLFVPRSPILGSIQRTLMAMAPAPDETRNNIINVFGEVSNPGAFEVNTTLDILDVLALAGGTIIPHNSTMITDLENIRIIRTSALDTAKRVRRFNLVEYFQTGDSNLLVTVKAGDDIMVPAKKADVEDKGKSVAIMGSVSKPDNYEISGSIRLDQLIARAGGFDCDSLNCHSRKDSVVIVSWNQDSTFSKSSFNYQKWEENPEVLQIPTLKANDHVLVLNKSLSNNRDRLLENQAHIHGEVMKPGSYYVGENMDLMEFVAGAGGIRLATGHTQIVVVRFVKGQRLQLIFDQDEFFRPASESQSRCASDKCKGVPLILPGDQVLVKERPLLRWSGWFDLVWKGATVLLAGYTITNTVVW